MPIKARENLFGAWAFLLGVLLSVIVGIFSDIYTNPFILGILSIIGAIVAIFVAEKDVQTFLFASVALVIVSFAGVQGLVSAAQIIDIKIGKIVTSILSTLLVMFVPATIIVCLKTVFSIARR